MVSCVWHMSIVQLFRLCSLANWLRLRYRVYAWMTADNAASPQAREPVL